jgi:phage-related protein|tara:strand:+ start:614 stop:784 length:171 start_codon:yes stop_codon:yes gene_type:complete
MVIEEILQMASKQQVKADANEVAPPGREKQVKALKGKVDNPYAVAWASYNKSKKKK